MFNLFYGTKLTTSSVFDSNGRKLAVTHIKVDPLTITQIKTDKKDGYWSIQSAIGTKSNKSLTKPIKSHLKGAKLSKAPRFLREIKLTEEPKLKVSDQIKVTDVFTLNDQVKVTGISKGRGFAGVIKRWGFHGGPRTHGQSDRERSIGSIGQRSDPGRVWKGKKMPGHFGTDTKTVRGLQVIAIDEAKNLLTVTGTVPGHRNSLLKITKTGTSKKPVQLFSKEKPVKKVKPVKKKTKKPASTPKQGE